MKSFRVEWKTLTEKEKEEEIIEADRNEWPISKSVGMSHTNSSVY